MKYRELIELYEKIDHTTKKIEKTFFITQVLRKIKKEDIIPFILLLQGRVFPEWDSRETGIASKLVIRSLAKISGKKISFIESEWGRKGDLGIVAMDILQKKKQSTLFSKELSIENVLKKLQKISSIEGEGAMDKKMGYLNDLLLNANKKEILYIVRTVLGELRIGIASGIIRDAIIWAFCPLPRGIFEKCSNCKEIVPAGEKCINCGETLVPLNEDVVIKDILSTKENLLFTSKDPRNDYNMIKEYIEEVYGMINDYGELASILYEKGINGLKNISMKVHRPFRVMLAQKVDSIEEGFKTVGIPADIEYKYDGFRLQIHKDSRGISLFTRRLENVTKQFPDVVQGIKDIKADSFILDSECVGIDKDTKKFLPFQHISQRIKRKYNIQEMIEKLPVELHIFDIIYLNGKTLIRKPLKERKELLKKIVKETEIIKVAKSIVTSDIKEVENFYHESINNGNEGIMMKNLSSIYKPGSRVGYMVKIKPTKETLDLVITGAEWGEGKRSEWLSTYRVACLNQETGEFLEIGKVGSGLKEKEGEGTSFHEITELLKPLVIEKKGKEVKLKPEVVVEVAYQEIQRSPSYDSGYALRFPRIVRIRYERSPTEITTLKEIENYYKKQRK